MKLSVSTLPSTDEQSLAFKYDLNDSIDRITISNLGDNISSINTTSNIQKGVPHIILDKLKDKNDLQEIITQIQQANTSEVLLLNGSSTYIQKSLFDMLEVISILKENNINVNIGGYIENLFWKKTDQEHFDNQAQTIKEKENAGAQRVLTQGIFHPRNVEPFIKTLRDKGVEIPIEIGILLPDNRAKLHKFTKKILSDLRHKNMAQVDWYLRIAYSYFSNTTKNIEKILNQNVLTENDGIYLQTLGQDATKTIEKVKRIIE